jgi:hypothetical protein
MPRDIAGNYSLPPAVNPVTTGTTITTTWANTTLNDIATALTDSLPRNGAAAMTGAAKFFAGTLAVPGISWAAETTSGLYRLAAQTFRYVVNGVEVAEFSLDGVSVTDRTNPPIIGEPAPSLFRAGYRGMPQRIWAAGNNIILYPSDSGKHIYRTWAGAGFSASIQPTLPVGFSCTLINRSVDSFIVSTTGGINLVWAGSGSVGVRTVAPFGMATIIRTEALECIITGVGIT